MSGNVGYATLQVIPSMKGAVGNLTKEATAPLEKAGDEAGKGYGKRFSSSVGGAIGTGLKAGGAAAGLALVAGIVTAVGQKDIAAGMQASMGLDPGVSAKFGAAAGLAYKQNYGESVSQVGDTIKVAFQNGLVAVGDSKEAIAGVVAQVETYAKISGEDAVNSTKAVGQMIKTGIAKNATEAFDILTKGQQLGLNNNEDLIDTFNEYGTQFRKLGIDGPQALGLINQAMKGGARDSDIAADALKEFSIRSIDGSKATATAFKAIGLDADTMAAKIAKGGPSAQAALQLTFDKLKAIKDPAAQAAAATGLFGTQAEDLGAALFAMDPGTAAKGIGDVAGATEAANKALGSTPTSQIASFTRGLKQGFVEVLGGQVLPALLSTSKELGTKFGPAVKDIVAKIKEAAPGILSMATALIGGLVPAISTAIGVIATIVGFLAKHETATKAAAITIGLLVAATSAYSAVMAVQAAGGMVAFIKNIGIISKVTKAYTAIQWLMNIALSANPIGLVVIAVAALIAVIVLIATKTDFFQKAWAVAWGAIKTGAEFVFNWVKANWPLLLAIITGPIGLAVLAIVKNFDTIKAGAGKVLTGITNAFKAVVSFFAGMPGKILAALSTAATFLVAKGKDFITGLFTGVKNAAVSLFTWYVNLPGVILSKVGAVGSTLLGKGKDLLNGMKTGVTNAAVSLYDFFLGLPGKIVSKLGNLGSTLAGAGKDLARGFINGIGDMVGEAANKARDLASAAKNAITGFLDIHSPSRVTRALGVFTGRGLADGMKSQIRAVSGAAHLMAQAALPAIGLAGSSASIQGRIPDRPGQGNDFSNGRPVEITVLADDPNATARKVGRFLANQGV